MKWFIGLLTLLVAQANLLKLPLVKREQPSSRRMSRLSTNSSSLLPPSLNFFPVPMKGNFPSDGEYYVEVLIGGQPLTLLVDTGSSDVGVNGKDCTGCKQKDDKPYEPSSTATPFGCDWCTAHKLNETTTTCTSRPNLKEKQCVMVLKYEDGSGFTSALWNDTFTFGRNSSQPTTGSVVGAIYKADFSNPKTIDGIVGLADYTESATGHAGPFQDLVATGQIDDVFSMCLHDVGGDIYFGSDDTGALSNDNTQWTPRVQGNGFYSVEITDVKLDGQSIGVAPKIYNTGFSIVDSGTQDVVFPKTAFHALKQAFFNLCSSKCLVGICNCKTKKKAFTTMFDLACFDMTEEERMVFPDVTIEMSGGVSLRHTPSEYLRNGSSFFCKKGKYTIGLEGQGDGEGTILGDTFMQGFLTTFDRREPQRIGFTPVSNRNCP